MIFVEQVLDGFKTWLECAPVYRAIYSSNAVLSAAQRQRQLRKNVKAKIQAHVVRDCRQQQQPHQDTHGPLPVILLEGHAGRGTNSRIGGHDRGNCNLHTNCNNNVIKATTNEWGTTVACCHCTHRIIYVRCK